MTQFKIKEWFPLELYNAIGEVRSSQNVAGIVRTQAEDRRTRDGLVQNESGRLAIVACDHPARMVVDSGDGSSTMGDRYEFLGRILRILAVESIDGVMVTPDLFEELMILRHILAKQDHPAKSMLDNRLVIGSMNRGGLAGTSFELDDRFTAFSPASIRKLNLDGGKMMFRLGFHNRDSLATIEACAYAITQLEGEPVFLECFEVEGKDHKSVKDAESLVKVVSVAQALGDAPRNLWLKLHYCEDFEKVARATTCPILLLGGSAQAKEGFFEEIDKGLRAGPNVRGVMVGRNVLFPRDGGDPYVFARGVVGLVHEKSSLNDVLGGLSKPVEEEIWDFSKLS